MKFKIKNYIKQFIDFTLTDEFKTMVMCMLLCFTVCGFVFGVLSTALVKETLGAATEQKEKYDNLQVKYEELQSDYNRLDMWSQELYELFITCQETAVYCEEIEGEYHE